MKVIKYRWKRGGIGDKEREDIARKVGSEGRDEKKGDWVSVKTLRVLIADRCGGRKPGCDLQPLTCRDANYAAAFQSTNVNICSEGINSSYLIYARWQIGSFKVYQAPHTHITPRMTPTQPGGASA